MRAGTIMNEKAGMIKFLLQYLLPGFTLIGVAFFAGSVSNPVFGMFGFLCFFTAGVTLIVEGWKRKKPFK